MFILWCIATAWSTALINIFMIMTIVLVVIDSIIHKRQLFSREFFLFPTVILFLLILISILWSSDCSSGFKNAKAYLPFIMFPIAFKYSIDVDKTWIKKGIHYMVYSIVIAYFITIIWNIIPPEKAYLISESFSSLVKPFTFSNKYLFGWYVPFMERIHFANLLTLGALSFTFLFLLYKKTYYLLISILLLTGPFLLGARASMIGVVGFLPFIFIYSIRKLSKKISAYFVIAGLFFTSFSVILFYPNIKARYNQTVYELKVIQDNSFKDKDYAHFATLTRFVSWKHAWKMFTERPVLGYGIGDYLAEYEMIYHQENSDLPMTYHSQFLYFLGIFGIVGFALFLSGYIYYGIKLKTNLSKVYFLCFTIYTFCVWFFDTGLLQKKEMMAFTLFLCFAIWLKKSETLST